MAFALINESTPPALTLPDTWSKPLTERLEAGERVLAWAEPDLDLQLRFAKGVLVLTTHRLGARLADGESWTFWPISVAFSLQRRDHAGVGTIELFDGATRLGVWHHTLGMNPSVRRLCDMFAGRQRHLQDPEHAKEEQGRLARPVARLLRLTRKTVQSATKNLPGRPIPGRCCA